MTVRQVAEYIDTLRQSGRLGTIRDTIHGVEVQTLHTGFGNRQSASYRIFPEATIILDGDGYSLAAIDRDSQN